ncbi:MAG: ribbon-helix-helix protein, CopG family [Acidimicrobiia bacterium]|nr:ribbon-helix-helix protein, CopG family [Acidimicrobiia bacterium]
MRKSRIVSITLPPEMFKEAEQLAKKENRTMSELMREAFRVYQRERRSQDDALVSAAASRARDLGLLGVDVERVLDEIRKESPKKLTKAAGKD